MLGASIPAEMISLVGGSLIGLINGYVKAKMDIEKQRNEILLQQHKATVDSQREAREGPSRGWKGFQWTRRVMALTVVGSVILLPKLAALMDDAPNVIYSWSEKTSGFLFFEGSTIQHWTIMNGIVISPVDIHAALAVIGLYFGERVSR